MINKRPINVNPFSIRLPITALVSIAHRLSGILVFLLIPLLLSALQHSLASPEGLAQVKDHFHGPLMHGVIWLLLAGIIFHLLAGLRHLIMDLHLAESLCWGRKTAWLVMALTVVLLLAAYQVWG